MYQVSLGSAPPALAFVSRTSFLEEARLYCSQRSEDCLHTRESLYPSGFQFQRGAGQNGIQTPRKMFLKGSPERDVLSGFLWSVGCEQRQWYFKVCGVSCVCACARAHMLTCLHAYIHVHMCLEIRGQLWMSYRCFLPFFPQTRIFYWPGAHPED